ncbi:lactoylglutathione lyase [Chitinophaga eiseniae]|uniref:Lactoylglutathione lyase n=1 Tax=Chitinophaga eiseniae TaxID=634771 RepID=A0A1T4TU40_9BACT|nr:VOC family protein [Chitinophaga eiseniae]SKA43946.1 lactoylglutathione lyase [Chitinophaga eiseniae]
MKKTNITGIHHLAIQANDFAATCRFYEALGLEPFHSWALPEYNITHAALLRIPGTQSFIEIFDKDANVATQGRRKTPGESVVAGALLHLALTVDDVDAACAHALSLGATICVEPCVLSLGLPPLNVRNALVYGLDGEVIEFIAFI